jgi:ankyrin repeat protein
LAVLGSQEDVAELLLENGAEVNARDEKEDTALRLAESYLLRSGKPMDARRGMAELLRRYGGHD